MRLLKWGWTLASIAACGFIAYRAFAFGSLIEQIGVMVVGAAAVLAWLILETTNLRARAADRADEVTREQLKAEIRRVETEIVTRLGWLDESIERLRAPSSDPDWD